MFTLFVAFSLDFEMKGNKSLGLFFICEKQDVVWIFSRAQYKGLEALLLTIRAGCDFLRCFPFVMKRSFQDKEWGLHLPVDIRTDI